MQLEPAVPELADRVHQQPLGVGRPRVHAGVGLEAPGVLLHDVREHLQRLAVHLGGVRDRHDHGDVNAGLVHLPQHELCGEVPAERGHVVDVHVGIDDHAGSVAAGLGGE